MIATTPVDILRFLAERASESVPCVIVTLVAIEGGSSRAVGAQMAVAADGRRIGSFSGGCIEDAVVAEALETLDESWGRVVRYGVGSPYIDLRLPCGGGIDLLFTPRPDPAAIGEVLAALEQRCSVALVLDCDGVERASEALPRAWDGKSLVHAYQPPLRVVVLGQGEELTAFARLGAAFGAQIDAYTPDESDAALLTAQDVAVTQLTSRKTLPAIESDPWTAVIFLFHGRDWEEHLLPEALGLRAFYTGAIGSRRTHATRLAALAEAGVSAERIKALRGHIGLIPATRDPATLAISVLAEIVADYNALAHWTHWMGRPLQTAEAK
ncbi:xanthine dehydrogenase accessory factor [Novosphingobium hassiacum]|uniref:Xanthine dehydrogenase accessory factor n=1 Tax=Novosphingobium hassiacum TaxID=173676 RepID=A0A7W5ZVV3_9SPHN|nr:XdhC family protein [Novosphingobium hassiacum]MBB3860337.1 xanthine dehydrogenase accessory factor [Novosphingobium hassiacum]